jgi:hypothetical protein
MKINWKYLKNPKIIIGAVILFVIVLWMLNRGASSSTTGSSVVTNGPSDAQIASQTQLAMAGISASVANNQTAASLQAIQEQGDIAIAMKTIDATTAAQTTAAQEAIAAASIGAQTHAMDLSYATSLSNNQLSFSVAKMAYDNANYSTAVNAGLEAHMADVQLAGFEFGSIVSTLPSLGKYGKTILLNSPLTQNVANSNNISYAPPPLPQTNWAA